MNAGDAQETAGMDGAWANSWEGTVLLLIGHDLFMLAFVCGSSIQSSPDYALARLLFVFYHIFFVSEPHSDSSIAQRVLQGQHLFACLGEYDHRYIYLYTAFAQLKSAKT